MIFCDFTFIYHNLSDLSNILKDNIIMDSYQIVTNLLSSLAKHLS